MCPEWTWSPSWQMTWGVPLAWLLGRDTETKVVEVTKTEIVREVIEVPVVEVREIHRKFFNPKWEEEEDETV